MDEQAVAREMYHLMFLFRKQESGAEESFSGGHGCKTMQERMSHRDMMFLNGIRQIHDGDLVKMSELSSNFRITPAAISQVIRQLEQQGLVERVILESDRRSVYVKVTQQANKLIKKQEKELNQNMIGLLRYLGEEDAEALLRIMRKSVEYINQIDK